jgi:PKD domain
MAAVRVVGVVCSLALVACLGCDDPGTTRPTNPLPEIGPVRSLALSVVPDRLPHMGGLVDVEVRATTDPGMRVGGDAVRLILVIDGREAGNPLPLDADGISRQRLFFSTATVVRVIGGEFMVEKPVTLDGAPPPPPPSPIPPPPPPIPPPPTPEPSVSVSLSASATEIETMVAVTFTAVATPANNAGAVTSYDWDFDGDGTIDQATTLNSTTHAYDTPGERTVSVTAHAGTITGSAQTEVTVIPRKLFVSLSVPPGPYTLGSEVTFTATVTSTGPVPTQLTWEWDENSDGTADAIVADQPSPQSRNIRLTATTPPTNPRIIRVTVTDPATGRTATTTLAITVS